MSPVAAPRNGPADIGLVLSNGKSTTNAIVRGLAELSVKWKYSKDFSFHGVPVHTLVPVFPLPGSMLEPPTTGSKQAEIVPSVWPSTAVIQGKITHHRRDYQSIFRRLMENIEGMD